MAGGSAGVAHLCGPRLLNPAVRLSPSDLKAALQREARALGFDAIGITDPDATSEAGKYFLEFLGSDGHGDMDWLA
ncbi:tRNA epoxyqueuosine(34) reductase QueG, partial [Klebsiella pneumoniae]|nr:tRNA epoxyqueuosine(34) reductase QueG [Klebsiella pneumoniae]